MRKFKSCHPNHLKRYHLGIFFLCSQQNQVLLQLQDVNDWQFLEILKKCLEIIIYKMAHCFWIFSQTQFIVSIKVTQKIINKSHHFLLISFVCITKTFYALFVKILPNAHCSIFKLHIDIGMIWRYNNEARSGKKWVKGKLQ